MGSGDSRKTLRVLGGTSSIARPVVEIAISNGYRVFATYRDARKIWHNEELTWIPLDSGNSESLENFLDATRSLKIDRVLFLLGALSGIDLTNFEKNNFDSYLVDQLINPSYLIIRLFESLKPRTKMLVMSSRATKRSYDFSYSIVKSGIESLVLSLKTRNESFNINYVRSGLILNSSMYFEMTEEDRTRHVIQSNGTLLSVDSAAIEIWKIFDKSWEENEGFFLGQEY